MSNKIAETIRNEKIGIVFGQVKVLSFENTGRSGWYPWVVCLLCGKEYLSSPKRAYNNQFGCSNCYNSRRITGPSQPGWRGEKYISKLFETLVRRGAERRGIDYNLSVEYLDLLWEQQKGMCPYTKLQLILRPNTSANTASVDRIDSSIGYIPGNVEFVHKNINVMKWDSSKNEFLELCNSIVHPEKFIPIPLIPKEKSVYWKGGDFIPGILYGQFKRGARHRNIDFDISIKDLDDIWSKQFGRCAYTGKELTLQRTRPTASLDRVDSSKAYIKGNIQFLHKSINRMKWSFSEEEFFANVKTILDNGYLLT